MFYTAKLQRIIEECKFLQGLQGIYASAEQGFVSIWSLVVYIHKIFIYTTNDQIKHT